MLGIVDVARAQVRYQKFFPAKHVKRQKTVMIIIAVEVSTKLAAVNRIIGAVKIQYQFFGRFLERFDKNLNLYA